MLVIVLLMIIIGGVGVGVGVGRMMIDGKMTVLCSQPSYNGKTVLPLRFNA